MGMKRTFALGTQAVMLCPLSGLIFSNLMDTAPMATYSFQLSSSALSITIAIEHN